MTEKINMKVMQYSKEYWEELKNNNSEHNIKNNEVVISSVSLADHDILCRLFKYATVVDDDDDFGAFINGYTNNSDATLNFGECLVNIETREVVKDNRK